ncbi:MAG: GatB/YqeY domain-containing protein [Lautropia sp.]|nr:GatB/YqeY domain-containing protein [Lautropia sp.]
MSTNSALKTRIEADMKEAMRARDKQRLGALRLLLAAIKQKEVDERVTLDDAQVLAIIEKLVKQRRDSIEQFEKAGRTELAEQERAELAVMDEYRPAQADAAEIQAVIEAAVAETGAAGIADMGKVMGIVKTKLAGKADLGAVSAQIRARLSA